MRKASITGLLLALLHLSALPAFADVLGTARLSLLQGDVIIQRSDTVDEWTAASANLHLMPGDRIWVPDGGRAEIQYIGGTLARADGNTYIDVSTLRREHDEHVIQIAVPEGRAYVNYRERANSNWSWNCSPNPRGRSRFTALTN